MTDISSEAVEECRYYLTAECVPAQCLMEAAAFLRALVPPAQSQEDQSSD
jgi:hypothetical protein